MCRQAPIHPSASTTPPFTVPLTPDNHLPNLIGAKASGLAELQSIPGVRVSPAFVITTLAFDAFLESCPEVIAPIAALQHTDDLGEIKRLTDLVQHTLRTAGLPPPLREAIAEAYRAFSVDLGGPATLVSIRSSGDNEDTKDASYAGQYATFLNVRGVPALMEAVRQVFASAYAFDAIAYARTHHPHAPPGKMAVIVQKMVQPTVAGTVFSVDLETGAPLISINATWGLGNAVVAGVVTPDVYVVDPVSLVVVKRRLGSKALIEAYDALARRTVRIATAPELARRFTLSFAEARDLARQAVAIAAHFRDKHGLPGVDLEFAIDDDGITMLQARSETALTRHQPHALAVAPEATRQASRLLMGGIAGSIGAVTGRVCIAATVEEAECKLAPGDILVVAETTHAWERLLRRAGGVITDIGGPGGHSAVVMRELRKPALVGTGSATRVLVDGSMITLDASRRTVWSGELPVAVPPAPAAAGASEESLQGVSEEDAWQEACRMTATFVDAGGRRWIGKPAYVVTPFMQTIYAEAHRRAGHRLGVPTRVQVLDGLHLVCFSDNWLWRQQAYALSLDDLDALHQARAHAIAEFLAASQALNPAPPVVEAWIEALIELNAMIGLSYTLYEAAEQMLAQVARTSRIPALVLLQARQAVVDRLGPSETALALREFDRLLVAVQRDDRLQAALHTASATGCLAPLAAVNARFVHQLRRYATRYKVVKADEPDLLAAAVELRLVALLAADLDARHEPAGPGAIELAVEEFFPEDLRLQRALGLAVAAERARQDAHHLRARGHRLTEQRLAGLVAFLQRRGEIATYSGLFAHSPAWLLLQAARYSGSA